ETAGLVAVAVELEPPTLGEGGRDPGEGHVRPLPRAEGLEVPQHDRVESEASRVRAHQVLAGELRDPVGRERRRYDVLRRRVAPGIAVDRRGGGEDEPGAGLGRRRAHTLRGEDVVPDVE